jgi:hypothetical protein
MAKAIRGHNLGTMVAIALLAALLLTAGLVLVVQRATTTGDRVESPAIGADGAKGPSITLDPKIERHAEVVALYRSGKPEIVRDSAGGSSVFRDPNIARHAEVVARHNQGTLR